MFILYVLLLCAFMIFIFELFLLLFHRKHVREN